MTDIIPGRRYTFAELRAFRDDPAFAKWVAKGYVWRHHLDGTLELVHWTKAHMDNDAPRSSHDEVIGETSSGAKVLRTPVTVYGSEEFGTPAVQKRTPQQRKESLIKRWWDACKAAGTVPGLTDEQITSLFGREWKTGESELTKQDIERMATAMLQDAESKT